LTDLPNRLLLTDRLNEAIELALRYRRQLAVLYLDVDRFKHINDSLGHVIGDRLLLSVAQRLLKCVRASDTISRQGGDEFVILLPEVAHPQDAALCADKMLEALRVPHRIDDHELHVTASIGIATYPEDGSDCESLIRRADFAMYDAKSSVVQARHECPRSKTPVDGKRGSACLGATRVQAPLPTQRKPADRPNYRRGGPDSLASP
jgi:diguanylate cyclase (GGDEF)-like protein